MKQQAPPRTQPITFRRWSNTQYAVFNSLKRAVRIGCLLVVYLRFANPGPVFAQAPFQSEMKNYELEAIDVSSDQFSETTSSLSRVLVTITKKEIERAPVSSFNELLEYVSNIDIRQRGLQDVQSDISIRGGTFDQVIILLNGINISDPQTGHHHLNLPVNLSAIERIEILKGPGAWKFGPGAFSGAIHIITKVPETNNLMVDGELGQFGYYSGTASAGFSLGPTRHLLTGMQTASDGYYPNTDFKIRNVYYSGSLKSTPGDFHLQAGLTGRSFGANSFYTAKFPEQYEEIQTSFAALSFQAKTGSFQIEPHVYYRGNNDRFLLIRSNPDFYSNDHTTFVWGAGGLLSYRHSSPAVTFLGLESRTESIFSTNLGEAFTPGIPSPVNDTIILDHRHSRSNFSLFVGHKRYFQKLMLHAAINLTRNSDITDRFFLFPGIDLHYQLSNKLAFFASLNQSMRMPTYTDLYYQGPVNMGNPRLFPEESTGFEAGIQFRASVVDASLTGFFMRGKNLIDWIRTHSDEPWQTVNYATLDSRGIEVSLKSDLRQWVSPTYFLQHISFGYTFIDQDKPKTEFLSNYSMNYLFIGLI